ncbi:MAG TPA: sigma-54-dependent Fis family transcriptional regulator [Porphyromonadaceae bacterium]|nr:sigma-54-dependent Fis family transcriptional regulator [Muribaculaceae bacterium Isolate-013 (NCI)]HAP30317.1 sigma-54-dependent Fis family transcriptional regulator [Porphyromonadaceae bacterium]
MILIADDDKAILLSLGVLLKRAGYEVVSADNPDGVIAAVRRGGLRLVMMDMNYSRDTSGEEGIELLQKIRILAPQVPVILMSGWGSIDLAVRGMRLGAFDFITKPWNNLLLLKRVATAIEIAPAHCGDDAVGSGGVEFGIIGKSPLLADVLATVRRVAPTDAPVLITGENGTGKELVAKMVHSLSVRAAGPFVKVNLGGMSQSLFESEMFGHVRGAYTGAHADRQGRFAVADKGTVFLDEIGDLDQSCQVKMLRVLQEHTFEPLGSSRSVRSDFRTVSATNADLTAMVEARTFREDLFYRINLITVKLPALRERREDIPLLARHFAGATEFSPEAMELLSRLPYPGNIRELKNLVERLSIIYGGDGRRVEAGDVSAATGSEAQRPRLSDDAAMSLEATERAAIERAMATAGGNLTRAAEILGITRQSLYRRLQKYGLS